MGRWLFCILLFGALAWVSPAGAKEAILVSAAASLTDVLKETGELYNNRSANRVSFSFGSSSTLARQIDEGAPVDVFFSADLAKMEELKEKGRIESNSQVNLLSNTLVIVIWRDSSVLVRGPRDLLKGEIKRIAIAEPSSVPAGIYARRYLEGEGIWDAVRRKIIPVLDVRAALAAVESGNADVGLVYRTDAAVSEKVKVAFEVPIEKSPKIVYPVAVVRESKKKAAAREFVEFLQTREAKEIFKRYGFLVLESMAHDPRSARP